MTCMPSPMVSLHRARKVKQGVGFTFQTAKDGHCARISPSMQAEVMLSIFHDLLMCQNQQWAH